MFGEKLIIQFVVFSLACQLKKRFEQVFKRKIGKNICLNNEFKILYFQTLWSLVVVLNLKEFSEFPEKNFQKRKENLERLFELADRAVSILDLCKPMFDTS